LSNKIEKMEEIWKDIEGYEGLYQVSNLGRVKSLDREVRYRNSFRNVKGAMLSLVSDKNGYLLIGLYKDGEAKTKTVHRLVAQTFIPNPDNLPCVCHKDDNPSSNSSNNLFWGTYQDNRDDCVNKDRQAKGNVSGMSKLIEKDIPEIWERLGEGESQISIAEYYNVEKSTIGFIKSGKSWFHITKDLKPLSESVFIGSLDEKDIPVIWERLRNKESQISIAKDYGVSRQAIGKMKTGRSWLHITKNLKPLT
jgi:hypothetical protein